jgi:UPF0271 protein
MSLECDEVYDIVLYQVAALKGICEAYGARLHHVKPHGALYNQAAKRADLSSAIAKAVKSIDPNLVFYGGSGSNLIIEAEKSGLRTASEVFADRTYQQDGSLTPRSQPNALITNESEAAAQAIRMTETGTVTSLNGETIKIRAETICIHGDGEHALKFAVALRTALNKAGIDVQAI